MARGRHHCTYGVRVRPRACRTYRAYRGTTGQRAKEMQRRARAMRQRADAHGIFDPAVNRLRASSACLCELRKSASVEEMRSEARHELVLGLPFEDEAALKVTLTLTLPRP